MFIPSPDFYLRFSQRFSGDFLRNLQQNLGFFSRPQFGPFFVLKFLRSRGLSSTVSKVRSDRKVLFEQKHGPLIAVNGR